MAGTNLNNNFALKQRKPLDERTTTRETVGELSAIKYPCPNLRVFVAGVVNAWHEYKLVNGVYTWVSDSNSVISYRDLRDLPSINGKQINEDLSLEDLGIQAKGNYLTGSSLNNYYRKDETLSSEEMGQTFPTKMYVEQELGKKVPLTQGYRLISTEEGDKLASAVTSGDLDPYSLKDTKDLEEATEILKEENQYIKFVDEAEDVEKKISLPNFILSASKPVYTTARVLVGEKDGKNETFTTEYNYIAGSEKLNINGSIYYPNSGFYKEGNNIILSGAPLPEAGDFMFLEAIYLEAADVSNENIVFADSAVKTICATNWGSDGEITYGQAAAVTDLGSVFTNNTSIVSFEELQYFTGLMDLDDDNYSGVFSGNTALKEIIIPNGVKILGWYCFEGCAALTSIVVPDSVISIEKEAFADTPFMNNMPQGVNYINRVLFKYIGEMPSETSIIVREGTISIAAEAFDTLPNLISITLPNTLQRIGYSAFYGCTGLTSIEIPESVTIIEGGAFSYCTGLTSVSVPNSVTKILASGFARCSNLVDITLGNSINFIGSTVFNENTKLKSITINAVIPPTLEDSHVFRSCSGLTNIYVPAESVDAYKAAAVWSAYADIITAIDVN